MDTDSGMVQSQIKTPVQERMEQLRIPGLSIAAIDEYRIDAIIAYGKRDSIHDADQNTLFQAASVSKYVTAIIVHEFIGQGILDLDKDINQYCTSWNMPVNEFTKDHPVTLRQLLSHQSGLPSTNFDYDRDLGMPNLVQVMGAESPAINKPAIPEFLPGSAWSYSNIGYALIQLMLEDVTGKPFQRIADEMVFRPMGMNNSTFDYPLPPGFMQREAMPFDNDGQQGSPDLDSPAKAQGGLITTAEDLARLTVEVMKGYQGRSSFISEETAHRLIHKELELPFPFYGQTAFMGQGVLIVGDDEDLAFLHNGYNSPGSVCIVIGFPETGQGAVIAINSANGEQLYLEIIATLADAYSWPSGQFFKAEE
jgi:CubicO group peptidase (beta-lactamase class C family)